MSRGSRVVDTAVVTPTPAPVVIVADEVKAVAAALGRLVVRVGAALVDGLITLDEAISIGVDAVSLGVAVHNLATPDEEERAKAVLTARARITAASALLRAAKRRRKLRETRRVVTA